ncbi:MAG: hypothetical protein P4L33_19345 [Capsulimonadaceae bacterium]|nr:hypothetical protein [Capsulimonadaceae bacterium]
MSFTMMRWRNRCAVLAGAIVLSGLLSVPVQSSNRPYEFEWANRTQDEYPPMLDFETPLDWDIRGANSVASIEQSSEQQLWGNYTGKLTYRATGDAPVVQAILKSPRPLPADFDSVGLWVYGRSMFYAPDPGTPPTNIAILFASKDGADVRVPLGTVNFSGWSYLFCKVSPDKQSSLAGGSLLGIEVANGSNTQDRTLFFDNLGVFRERLAPLAFEARPLRNLTLFPGQQAGLNKGPGALPFPTREETILPPNLTPVFQTNAVANGGEYEFRYHGKDGELNYRLDPRKGPFDGLTAQWDGRGAAFHPCVGGGLRLAGGAVTPLRPLARFLSADLANGVLTTSWSFTAGTVKQDATIRYRIWNKSLVIDVLAPGGQVAEVRFGREEGLPNPRLIASPYYAYQVRGASRPCVLVSGSVGSPLFLAGNIDWYRSNASELFASNVTSGEGVAYNGGTRYTACTNGRRNDCFERFFLTVSPRYEEVLPVIANPKSPYIKVAGTHLWRAVGASPDKMKDRDIFRRAHRYGLTQLIITNHETLWRDGSESFTFRTRTAPAKGGDEAEKSFARYMQDDLGYVYGPYNNFTDLAPVNANWSLDNVSRKPDYSLVTAWARCYNPKPSRAVEYAARLTPIIQAKFGYSTAYCDVHTAVPPWGYTDFDSRVPGAGTFASTFYSYGEIMLIQKQNWRGPVYSEGGYHWMYMGLTDGNYAQDQGWDWDQKPWLVDFDLRRMHDQGANFGMGNLDMFRHGDAIPPGKRAETDAALDRFTAATMAFGHPGFWAFTEPGLMMRNYYMVQQIAARYTQAQAAQILYVGEDGVAHATSDALANDAYRRSQVAVSYADGTVVVANGNRDQRLKATLFGRCLDLPPNGYAAWTGDGAIDECSSDPGGNRCDYAATPAYIYIDGRGHWQRFPLAASDGPAVARNLGGGRWEVIHDGLTEAGFAIGGASAVALDIDGKEMGPATLRMARGLTYVLPVPGAFSYRVEGGDGKATTSAASPLPAQDVLAGQSVSWKGDAFLVPAGSPPGTRLWHQFGRDWLDFTVVPYARLTPSLSADGGTVNVDVSGGGGPATLRIGSVSRNLVLVPGQTARVRFALDQLLPAAANEPRLLTWELGAGGRTTSMDAALSSDKRFKRLIDFERLSWQPGIELRPGSPDLDMDETSAGVDAAAGVCGGIKRHGIMMHPPYVGAVGCSYALYDPVTLPRTPAVFRAFVGKRDGSVLGDGILYRVVVVDANGHEADLATLIVKKHEWLPIEADLSRYAGQAVRFKLVSDVGPKDDSAGDWAAWAEMRVETASAENVRVLDTTPEGIAKAVRGTDAPK